MLCKPVLARHRVAAAPVRSQPDAPDERKGCVSELPVANRPEVVLPAPPPDAAEALAAALAGSAEPRPAIAEVVAAAPTYLDAWAELSRHGRDRVERYAYARVGYHRGLDAIRRNGWGGNGYVRWRHPSNRGFLRCLFRLRAAASEIGEHDEVDRVGAFLVDLDPDWDDAFVASG